MKKKDGWLKIPDDEVCHIWTDPDGKHATEVPPWFYADSGTPICDSNSKHDGEDKVYKHTEVSPRIAEAIAFQAKVEPVLHRIYDVLYFDSAKNSFNPDKEWDSAADFLEMVADQMILLYGRPKRGSLAYPILKQNKA
jgi:hypothetical protein